MRRLALVLLLLFMLVDLAGCTPTVDSIRVATAKDDSPPRHEELLRVAADITVKKGGAETPIVELRPVAPPGGAYSNVGKLDKLKEFIKKVSGYDQYRFTGDIAGLNYGAYDLQLLVPYHAWLKTETFYATSRFNVGAPASCFSFDSDQQGFTLGPVTGSHGKVYNYVPSSGLYSYNWPVDARGNHSLKFAIDSHFPVPPPEGDEPSYWTVDFISPDLTQYEGWQQSQGVTFRAASVDQSLWAQPVFIIKQGNIDRYYAPKDTVTGKFMVFPFTHDSESNKTWGVMDWRAEPVLPEGVRTRVLIRIYGASIVRGESRDVFVDGICPIPPGIDPPGGNVVAFIPNPLQK